MHTCFISRVSILPVYNVHEDITAGDVDHDGTTNIIIPRCKIVPRWSIFCFQRYIYATGWHKKVYVLNTEEEGSNEHFQSLRHVHKEDILCMIFIPQNMLVTASYDGDIIVVARETGNTILRINACQSRYPIVKDIHGKAAHIFYEVKKIYMF